VPAGGEGFVEDGQGGFGLGDGLEFLRPPQGVFGFGCVVRHSCVLIIISVLLCMLFGRLDWTQTLDLDVVLGRRLW